MNDPHSTDRDDAALDHWAMFAEAMDLTLDGHRLIAQEIAYECKLLWRGFVSWFRDPPGVMARRRSSPSA